jgi:hypothetical protein
LALPSVGRSCVARRQKDGTSLSSTGVTPALATPTLEPTS